MSKFLKKISKAGHPMKCCLLVGQGFGFLEEFLKIFKTVFIVDKKKPDIRVKNLVFRDNEDNLSQISELTHIFFDRSKIEKLDKFQHLWCKHNSLVMIEGDEPISREFSKPLYSSGWQCTSTSGYFHTWEKIK